MRAPTRSPDELRKEISALKRQIGKLEKTKRACEQAQAGWRESEARCQTIIDAIPDGYVEADLAGNFTFINNRICEHLDYPKAELIGANIRRFQNAAGFQKTFRVYNQIFKTGKPCKSFELACLRKNGSQKIFEVSASLARDAQGRPVGFCSVSRDITERKKMERALRESENRYRMIVENINESVSTMDLNLNYTYVSPSEIRTSGYTPEEAMRTPPDKELTPESYAMALGVMAEEIKREFGGGPVDIHRKRSLELAMYKKNGDLYWQETTTSFLRDENGQATGFLFVGRDITARKQAEKDLQAARDQLLQAEKLSAIGQLSAGVAHEILNPLNIISLELQLIQEMKNLPRDVSEELSICMAQIDRIVAIADGLMQLARVSDKKMETTQINDLIAGILTLHKAQLMIDKIETVVRYQDSLPEIPMDRKKIEQVILNLISNARGAMEGRESKILRIATDREGTDAIRITVADTGRGIATEHLSKLFNPFFTTKAQGKGTGLGLSISYGIIKDHGGRIWAENNSWGGASFYISLPVRRTMDVQAP
ncbi:MAG: PAS domain S-box protein [Smithellaceae bacterium]|nr:PAS domain S-box protein [Smithellaceae bacterium]